VKSQQKGGARLFFLKLNFFIRNLLTEKLETITPREACAPNKAAV
jgi:hypothetical protein